MEDRYSSRLRATVFCTDNHPTVKKVSDGPRWKVLVYFTPHQPLELDHMTHTLSAISSHETFIPGSAIEWHCNHLCEGNVEESSRPAGYLLDMPRAGGYKTIDNRSINPHPCWRSITQGMISLQIFSGSPAPPPLCQQAWTWKYVTSAADMPHTLRSSSTKGLKR